MKKIFLLLITIVLFSCEDEPVENKELSKQLVGEWQNITLKIKMNSYKNTDSVKFFEVAENDWEKVMKIRPIKTYFRSNRTYNSEHINLNDSIIFNPAGKWKIIGDSLFMTDTFPKPGTTYTYRLIIKNSLAQFWSIEDCDADGQRDDEYFGQQWKAIPR